MVENPVDTSLSLMPATPCRSNLTVKIEMKCSTWNIDQIRSEKIYFQVRLMPPQGGIKKMHKIKQKRKLAWDMRHVSETCLGVCYSNLSTIQLFKCPQLRPSL